MSTDNSNSGHDIEDLKKAMHHELMKQFGNISMDEIYTIIKSVRPDLKNVSLNDLIEKTVKKTQEEMREPYQYKKPNVYVKSVSVTTQIFESTDSNILIFRISGNYKPGSQGNDDGAHIGGNEGVEEVFNKVKNNKYKGLIVDMQELTYLFGNGLTVFNLEFINNLVPVAYVAGDKCIEGIKSLTTFLFGMESKLKIFTDFEKAIEYIESN